MTECLVCRVGRSSADIDGRIPVCEHCWDQISPADKLTLIADFRRADATWTLIKEIRQILRRSAQEWN